MTYVLLTAGNLTDERYTTLFVLLAILCVMELMKAIAISTRITKLEDSIPSTKDILEEYEKLNKPKPVVIAKNKNIVPLYAQYNKPHWVGDDLTDDNIREFLVAEIAKDIPNYLEIQAEKDILRMETVYKARLMVCEKEEN